MYPNPYRTRAVSYTHLDVYKRQVMVILPGAGGELLTEAGSRDIFEDVYDEMEADLVADGELLLLSLIHI